MTNPLNKKISIVVAVNNSAVLQNNLLISPDIANDNGNIQLLCKENYASAALAYNSAIDEAENEIIIFIHQDIYLPEGWFADLQRCLSYLAAKQSTWGVLGCFGSRRDAFGGLGQVYTNGLGVHGNRIAEPEPVETLDEIILVIRKSSGLRFDPALPHFHLYGTDLCLIAKDMGMTNYAFQGFCIHNTNQLLQLPQEFYQCHNYVKAKWAKYLPIYASCMTITRFNKELYKKQLSEFLHTVLRKKQQPVLRVSDPRAFLGKLGQ
jgi:glycosyltransferase involved in cell wall biosynthesis